MTAMMMDMTHPAALNSSDSSLIPNTELNASATESASR